MNLPTAPKQAKEVLEVNSTLRWQVYQRLQELDVCCECNCHQPLKVDCQCYTDIIQIWSVVRQQTASRAELVGFLNSCWQLKAS